MSIFQSIAILVRKMAPSIDKNTMALDLPKIFDLLNGFAYTGLMAIRGSISPKNAVWNTVDKQLRGRLKYSGPLDVYLANICAKISSEEVDISKLATQIVGRQINRDTLDMRQLNFLMYVDSIRFFADYVTTLVDVAATNEAKSLKRTPIDKQSEILVTDLPTMLAIIRVCEALSLSIPELTKKLNASEGHLYNEEDYDAMRISNPGSIDPFNYADVADKLFFIANIGYALNIRRKRKYDRHVDLLAKTRQTVLLLEEERSGTSDPEVIDRLSKGINYYSNRINKIDEEIARLES